MRNTVATTVRIEWTLGADGAPTYLMIDIDMVVGVAAIARCAFIATVSTAINRFR